MNLKDPSLTDQMIYLAKMSRKALGAEFVVVVAQMREKKTDRMGSIIAYDASDEVPEIHEMYELSSLLLKAANTVMSTQTDIEIVLRNKKTGVEFRIEKLITEQGVTTNEKT